ncbi:MAG: hypothetical protein DRO99_03315 [Candidatus Aenigmatarchaeota archaeon]|nr:MAG: hypothetical protein DRO99_03315 [Candidatus Aenigmarchaeota archaeon]
MFGHCCSGSCVNTYTSSTHCGSCGNTCQPNAICFSGECIDSVVAAAADGFSIGIITIIIASLIGSLMFVF